MTLPDALIEQAHTTFDSEYRRLIGLRVGIDEQEYDDAVRGALEAVIAVVQDARAAAPGLEWRWEYRVKSGSTICHLGYTNEQQARDWLERMSYSFRRCAHIERRVAAIPASAWTRLSGVTQPEERAA